MDMREVSVPDTCKTKLLGVSPDQWKAAPSAPSLHGSVPKKNPWNLGLGRHTSHHTIQASCFIHLTATVLASKPYVSP